MDKYLWGWFVVENKHGDQELYHGDISEYKNKRPEFLHGKTILTVDQYNADTICKLFKSVIEDNEDSKVQCVSSIADDFYKVMKSFISEEEVKKALLGFCKNFISNHRLKY